MDLLSSTIFHIIIFPKQVVACFINFSHVELITSHIFHCFCHLSIYLPLYFPREMEQLIEIYPSSSPFHSSLHSGGIFLLVYTFWKLAWDSVNVAKKLLRVCYSVNSFFGWCVLGFSCPDSKLTNIKPKWFHVKRFNWKYRLSDMFFLYVEAEFCHAHGKKLF